MSAIQSAYRFYARPLLQPIDYDLEAYRQLAQAFDARLAALEAKHATKRRSLATPAEWTGRRCPTNRAAPNGSV